MQGTASTGERETYDHMKSVKIYADGSCIGNPGPGGWAAVIAGADAGRQIEAKGCDWHTTNSRMEIRAALGGLTAAAAQEAPEKMDVSPSTPIHSTWSSRSGRGRSRTSP